MANKMFLPSDRDRADSLLNRYEYHMHFAIKFMLEGDFDAASRHHAVIADTLEQLGILKANKQAADNAAKFYQESRDRVTWEDVVNGLKSVL